MRYVRVLYVGFVGSVVEDERVVPQRVVYPLAQFFLADCRARGVVRVAQVDDVYAVVGYLRHEVVFLQAWHIRHVAPLPVNERAGAAAHHVAVYVHRVDWVGDSEVVVPPHQLADVARVALRPVVDEYLARVDVYAARQEVVFRYGLAQEQVALLRAVAVERVLVRHVVNGLVHGLHHRRAQRLRHVPDAEAYDVGLGVRRLECVDLLCYVGKEVVLCQL